jgi:hypothetical protein
LGTSGKSRTMALIACSLSMLTFRQKKKVITFVLNPDGTIAGIAESQSVAESNDRNVRQRITRSSSNNTPWSSVLSG